MCTTQQVGWQSFCIPVRPWWSCEWFYSWIWKLRWAERAEITLTRSQLAARLAGKWRRNRCAERKVEDQGHTHGETWEAEALQCATLKPCYYSALKWSRFMAPVWPPHLCLRCICRHPVTGLLLHVYSCACTHARTWTRNRASSLLSSLLLIESQACSLWLTLSLEVCWSQQPGGVGLNIPSCFIPAPLIETFPTLHAFLDIKSRQPGHDLFQLESNCSFLLVLPWRFPFLTFPEWHLMAV